MTPVQTWATIAPNDVEGFVTSRTGASYIIRGIENWVIFAI
jgi:hypothetical protein